MPRHEPSQRADPGEVLAGKIVMKRTPDGKLLIAQPPPPGPKEPTEQAERDASSERDLPPDGGA